MAHVDLEEDLPEADYDEDVVEEEAAEWSLLSLAVAKAYLGDFSRD